MEEKQISQTQLCALLWAGLMAPAAELLPAVTLPIAGRGAWLSALAALPVLLLLGWGLGRLGLRHGGLAGAIRWGLGPVVGRLALLLYFIWGELLLALRLRLCAQRLIASGERDGSLWFFLPAAALLVLWMARGKLPAFAHAALDCRCSWRFSSPPPERCCFSPCPRSEGSTCFLCGGGRPAGAPVDGSAAGGAGLRGLCRLLLGDTEPSPRRGRDWTLWAGGGCLLLGAEQAVGHRQSGPGAGPAAEQPLFCPGQKRGVEGAFQRVESIIAALWTFADLSLLGVLPLPCGKAAKAGFSQGEAETDGHGHPHPGAVLGIAAFPEGVMADAFGRETALLGNLMMGLALPLLVLAVCWGGRCSVTPHILCIKARKRQKIWLPKNKVKKRRKKLKKMIDKGGIVCYDSEALAGSKSVAPSETS